MELVINELDNYNNDNYNNDNYNNDNYNNDNYNNDNYNYKQFEEIPENKVFNTNKHNKVKKQHQKISYEDILSKMGMFVSDGKLHLIDRNTLPNNYQQEQLIQNKQPTQNINPEFQQNSYIYNKYFNEYQQQPVIRKPKTLAEYKQMLVHDYIQRQRVKQIKSTKLLMPTSNINISSSHQGNFNKLFNFSKR
jgi:hypothetical protein